MAPVLFSEGFAETARKGLSGKDPKWHAVLVWYDMHVLEKSRRITLSA